MVGSSQEQKNASGGRIAISGFDYQAIVILDRLFDHFDRHAADARARPEGQDDLDLIWTERGLDRRRHIQIKKPRETEQGVTRKRAWRLPEIADEFLPNALDHLAASSSHQTWILGDMVRPEVRRLVAAGSKAAVQEAGLYWSVVHLMARAAISDQLKGAQRKSLLRWRFKGPLGAPSDTRDRLIGDYGQMLRAEGVDVEIERLYQQRVAHVDQRLPGILARVEILDGYGSEAEVGQRFRERLQREYRLSAEVVENNLFGNFRSFINDVAKRPGEMIDRRGFEVQLRSAWPQMSSATEPPALLADGIPRPDLTEELVKSEAATVIEVLGISGSGKTTLAAQAAAALGDCDPGRLPIYVRVRADAAFRDVMSGVAFHLLRRGMPEMFSLAVDSRPADDTVIDRLAEVCSGLSRPVQLFLDLVEGACNAQFGRDLGRFARALTAGSCRLVVFGQQSTFGALSPVEAGGAGISVINMRGFRWEEFVRLVGRHHLGADRNVLWGVFNRVTVGRPAGLHAQLAESLARQPSLDAMLIVASRPPEDMLSAAEQSRFNQLAPSARSAAECLVCFAMPFQRRDAEAAFPGENVGAALKALVDLGLLRTENGGLLEMHETVRAGLESGIASRVRQSAHGALANLYREQGDLAAQIFHLDKAGRSVEADVLAREAFLRGEAWSSLANYLTRRALLTGQEIIDVAARPERIADFYLLRSILPGTAGEETAALLMALLVKQRHRYFVDHEWARPMVEAILAINPSRFQDLLVFTVAQAADAAQRREGLAWLLIGARRGRLPSSPEIAAFAKMQPADVQRMLLPVLLAAGRRDALALAFEIVARPADEETRRGAFSGGGKLIVDRREDAVEILAALPNVSASTMLATRSLAFGQVGSLIWEARHQLRPFCADILTTEGGEVENRITAWRVLIFIGHTPLETLVDPMASAPIPMEYALLGPAFSPTSYNAGRYERTVLESSAPASDREAALAVLLFLGVDLGRLRNELAALRADPLSERWDTFFLLLSIKQPFPAAVPLLKAQLASPSAASMPSVFLASCLTAVAEAAWPDVTDLLMLGVQHIDPAVRTVSAHGLARRRSHRAAEVLQRQIAVEPDIKLISLLAQALTASGPRSARDLASGSVSSELTLWQCIVAMRTREEGFAPVLIQLATDPSAHWVVRRAAIWAAGRLPFSAALQVIAPAILAENTPLTIDVDDNLQVHSALSILLHDGVSSFLHGGEANFMALVVSILERQWGDLLGGGHLPPPFEVAQWLYTSLMNDPSPGGVQRLLNGLHTPLLQAAVVRAFRLCDRAQEIEDVLTGTSSVWLAVKCLQERRLAGNQEPGLILRLRRGIAASPCADSGLLVRILDEIEEGRRQSQLVASASPVARLPEPASTLRLDYAAAVRALRGTSPADIDAGQPIALSRLDRMEVQRLIALADPANDLATGVSRFSPRISFTPEGHVVGRESLTSTGGMSVPERLRPAIAAANRFGLPMPWHNERLRWPWAGGTYGPQFLASLGAQGDAERFYQALDADSDILLPLLGRFDALKATQSLLDERLVPILQRCLLLGDDVFFESLCNLVQRISTPTVVPLLAGLLGRWASRFDTKLPPQAEGHELWRGFARLSEHPRLRDVPGWRRNLEIVLAAPMPWFHKQDIVRVFEADPGSYVTIEGRMSLEENWVHFSQCEINRLDDAAERLFHEFRQT